MYVYLDVFIHLADHMLTSLLTLMITYSHVYLLRWYVQMLWWSHAPIFTYLDDSMLPCLHALMIVCSHAYMIWLSHGHMPMCPNAYICLDALLITCSHCHMLLCSYVLTCLACHKCICFEDCIPPSLYAWRLKCLNAHILWWSHASKLTCLVDHMLLCRMF